MQPRKTLPPYVWSPQPMTPPNDAESTLLDAARSAGGRAYCPYSRFPVGAAVETDIGRFTGCNIENASYGLAVCAERVALFTAIAAGAKRIDHIAVSCLNAGESDPVGSRMPCGACRQVITEFMAQDATVTVDGAGVWRVADLLPTAFQLQTNPFLDSETAQSRNALSAEEPAVKEFRR